MTPHYVASSSEWDDYRAVCIPLDIHVDGIEVFAGPWEFCNGKNISGKRLGATPAAAMVSLSQVNEVAALVGTLLGIAFLLWRWHKQWKAGNVKNLD